jgi:hypothetical protein
VGGPKGQKTRTMKMLRFDPEQHLAVLKKQGLTLPEWYVLILIG